MKALLLTEAGGVENLIYGDIDKPTLKTGEILVKVKAIGINPADAHIRKIDQMIDMYVGTERPAILGWDIAGDIVEKADETDGFEIGDSVFGFTHNGRAYAEYVAIPTGIVAHKPANMSYEEAAAFPLAGLTGGQPLIHTASIKEGDTVLIHAASGGVGHYAVQIAKYLGAEVIATSSAKNRDFVLSLGADEHIDYATQKFYEKAGEVDFVLDTVGYDTLAHSIAIVKNGGKIVTVIPPLSEDLVAKAAERNIQLTIGMVSPSGTDMAFFADMFSKGVLKSRVTAVYPFSDIAKAHAQMETGRTVGKVVVTL